MPEGLDIYTDRKVYTTPDGLNELMYDISKEVLRCQPKNLYAFISDFLINMLKVREAVKVAVPIIETDFYVAESHTEFLQKYNLTKEKADHMATIIQAAYRGYRTRKRLLHLVDEFNKAEEKISLDVSDENVDYDDEVFQILKTRGVHKAQRMAAATKIQAYYRGYKVRKMEVEKGIECLAKGVPSHESWRHDWLDEFLSKKRPDEELPWRKSFTDFQMNYTTKFEGDRLHLETIFGGKYEDYNLVCDETSCDMLAIPTKQDIEEIALLQSVETSASEMIDIPGALIVQEEMQKRLSQRLVEYPQSDELMLFENKVASVSSVKELEEKDRVVAESGDKGPLPVREESKPRVTKSSASVGSASVKSLKSGGSIKSRASKKSTASGAPELTVKSLSKTEVADEGKSSITSLVETASKKSSARSIGAKQPSKTSVKSARRDSNASADKIDGTSAISKEEADTNDNQADNAATESAPEEAEASPEPEDLPATE